MLPHHRPPYSPPCSTPTDTLNDKYLQQRFSEGRGASLRIALITILMPHEATIPARFVQRTPKLPRRDLSTFVGPAIVPLPEEGVTAGPRRPDYSAVVCTVPGARAQQREVRHAPAERSFYFNTKGWSRKDSGNRGKGNHGRGKWMI